MKSIYKYPLILAPRQVLEIPLENPFALILINRVKVQLEANGGLALWCTVDTDTPKHNVIVQIVGTGVELPDGDKGDWIATIQDGGYVWHVFVKCFGEKSNAVTLE